MLIVTIRKPFDRLIVKKRRDGIVCYLENYKAGNKINVTRMCKLLGNFNQYDYYLFEYDKTPRFIYCTAFPTNFLALDINSFRSEKPSAIISYGALYDLNTDSFVDFGESKTEFFYRFLLYDSGIPHVIYDAVKDNYKVFFMDNDSNFCKNNFVETAEYCEIKFISHLSGNKLSRIIFYRMKDNNTYNRKMIVLENELDYKMDADDILLARIIYNVSKSDSGYKYFNRVHKQYAEIGSLNAKLKRCTNERAVDDDAIIIMIPDGLYGNYAFLRIKDGVASIEKEFSMVRFEKFNYYKKGFTLRDNIIICYWEENDFEVCEAYYDVSTGGVFCSREELNAYINEVISEDEA